MSTVNSSPTPPPPWPYFFAGAFLSVLIFALGAASFWIYQHVWLPEKEEVNNLAIYHEAWELIDKDFIGTIPNDTALTYGAIRGSMETLGDPYTYFIEPKPADREREKLQGNFGGIGAYLILLDDGRISLKPMIDRPAERVGIKNGDILLTVDAVAVTPPADLDTITDLLRGPVGEVVQLTVLRQEEKLEFEIVRSQIELPTVSWKTLEEAPTVGYIRIERFSGVTTKEVERAITELHDAGSGSKLILDLRANPGGLLDQAVSVSDIFLNDGLILIEQHSDGSEVTYKANRGGLAPDAKLVVLIDKSTASAAEIVAGALQDHQRAILMGETSYGKGSVQRIHPLSDNSAVHVTFARWLTPNGNIIDKQGLVPDIAVPEASDPEQEALLVQLAIDQLK